MLNTSTTVSKQRHEFGHGIIRELAKYLYKNLKSAFKEAVSNALDQMSKDDARVEIYTDVPPDGDIVIEDWGAVLKISRDSNTLQ
jgi:Zn-dependent metalloprotease